MKTAEFRRALEDALHAGGAVMRRCFGRVHVRYKGKANLLTEADLKSQEAILGIIRRRFPDHDWRAEEKSARRSGSDFLWLVDPLDGTTNYAHGYPASCVSIALLRRGRPILSGVYDPFRGERFTAEAGRGARLNGRPMRVSKPKRLKDSLLITGFPYDREEKAELYLKFFRGFLLRCHDLRRSGSAALDMAWVAAGRADGYWEFGLSPWDVAAGSLLVAEAGGTVTDFSGGSWSYPGNFGAQTLATNGRVHQEMLAAFRSIARKA